MEFEIGFIPCRIVSFDFNAVVPLIHAQWPIDELVAPHGFKLINDLLTVKYDGRQIDWGSFWEFEQHERASLAYD